MPKMKTNRGAAKRFKATKSGKFKRNKAFARHLKTCKTSKRRRSLRKGAIVEPQNQKAIKLLLPFG